MIQDVSEDIKAAVRSAAKHLGAQCGATVRDHKFKELRNSLQVCGKDIIAIKDLPNPLKGVSVIFF